MRLIETYHVNSTFNTLFMLNPTSHSTDTVCHVTGQMTRKEAPVLNARGTSFLWASLYVVLSLGYPNAINDLSAALYVKRISPLY